MKLNSTWRKLTFLNEQNKKKNMVKSLVQKV